MSLFWITIDCYFWLFILGDFRQTLPVVSRGSREQIVAASFHRSPLWPHIEVIHLKKNMRLDQTPENVEVARWLLTVGAGEGLTDDRTITLPASMWMANNSLSELIKYIYPNIQAGHFQDCFILERTILSGRNDDVDEINQQGLDMFSGQETVYWSTDKTIEEELDDPPTLYPVEFLQNFNASGLPCAKLALKIRCPLMLLRNLDPANGLCNGTWMILTRFRPYVLECHLLSGNNAGKTVFIPCITINADTAELPISFSRCQFPVRLAFAMTINKSQGQSVTYVGLDLRTPIFSHGQLYVALSHCTSG